MLSVLWTPQARRDYQDVIDYLDDHSSRAADRFADRVATMCRLLESSPRLGRARDELHPGLRSLVIGKYLLFTE